MDQSVRDKLSQRMTDDTIEGPTEAQLHKFWRLRWGIWLLIQDSINTKVDKGEYYKDALNFMEMIAAIRPLKKD
jgi:hypothetical protein